MAQSLDSTVVAEAPAPPRRAHVPWWRSRWVQGLGSLAVVVLIFGFLFPKVADYRARADQTGGEAGEIIEEKAKAIAVELRDGFDRLRKIFRNP